MKSHLRHLILLIIILITIFPVSPAKAQTQVVHAVLFFAPTCGHCQYVINEVLPSIIDTYGKRLEIAGIDVTTEQGQALYQTALEIYNVSDDRVGVPALFLGDTHLIGSREIPEQLTGLIDTALVSGGVDWPDIPGLREAIQTSQETPNQQEAQTDGSLAEVISPTDETHPVSQDFIETQTPGFSIDDMRAAFAKDPVGNTVAVIMLALMVLTVIGAGYRFINGPDQPAPLLTWKWAVPLLALIGLGISIYMSYVEIFHQNVVCGPLEGCNTVQTSKYAYLFGAFPVGVLGLFGYVAMLVTWLIQQYGSQLFSKWATTALWGMTWFGILFSIYLTFLEPFVIGATCTWCISSAIIITLLLWVANEQARLIPEEE